MDTISQSASSATPVDLSEKTFAFTASIVFRMAFGHIFQGSDLDNHKFEKLIRATEYFMGGFTTEECIPYVGWIIDRCNGYHAKLKKVFHELDTFFEKAINDHLKPERKIEGQEDIIDVMLKIEKDQIKPGEAQITKDNIKAVLLDIFLGGVDTSAITVPTDFVSSMPCASKKQKGKGVSASGSCVGVRHQDYIIRLELNLGKAILSERNIDLNNLIGSSIPQQVDAKGWRQFVTTAHRINERVVREFYAAMDPKKFEKGTSVKVRGLT
ncbi:hypothetical protein LWI28_012465 [Acer negundo]|uniref:Cytochrome P450 n=1 Tax=Acer negundo TaxID=4023 RepID=A0AAD5IM74_ACENE|nr:hypothetical protein LWI28_012465 [Acer negundo]